MNRLQILSKIDKIKSKLYLTDLDKERLKDLNLQLRNYEYEVQMIREEYRISLQKNQLDATSDHKYKMLINKIEFKNKKTIGRIDKL